MANQLHIVPRFWLVFAPLVCIMIFGIVGNVLTLITVLNKRCKKTSFVIIIAALAITDTVVLVSVALHVSLRYVSSTITVCKFLAYCVYGSRHISVWLVSALSVERTFAVYFPSKVKILCVPKTGFIVVAITIAVLSFADVHFLFGYTFGTFGKSTDCVFTDNGFKQFYLYMYPWIDLTIGFILPAIVIVTSNSAILVRVFKMTGALRTTAAIRNDKNKQLLRIAFLVSTAYLVLYLPGLAYTVIRPYIYEIADSAYTFANEYDANINAALANLVLLNHAINFILYVFSGKRFRNEFKNALCRSLATVRPEPRRETIQMNERRNDRPTDRTNERTNEWMNVLINR